MWFYFGLAFSSFFLGAAAFILYAAFDLPAEIYFDEN
ncbi:hypothetical protein M2171_006528 [Bradyrhizobium japonicum USDA 38]|nr:hypothetical protein [Bradyrhizobium japonicum USDA 38]MCS3949910.1 hypothetical protein [Bradyrhizobium japonicum]